MVASAVAASGVCASRRVRDQGLAYFDGVRGALPVRWPLRRRQHGPCAVRVTWSRRGPGRPVAVPHRASLGLWQAGESSPASPRFVLWRRQLLGSTRTTLLGFRQRRLLGGELHASPSVVGHKLVARPGTDASSETAICRTNAKAIDRRAVGDEACDLRLVEIAAGDDSHARQPCRVELPPGPPGLHDQIARVQPYGGRCGGHTGLTYKLDYVSYTSLSVVGID